MLENLGLDEALISVNKSIIEDPIDVFYQIDECFACPLDKLKTLIGSAAATGIARDNSVVIGTKFKVQLELRNAISGSSLCRLQDLSLNNHGHYMIDLVKNTKESNLSQGSQYECFVTTLASGDCYLCPIAMLLFILLLITACEQVYSKFFVVNNKTDDESRTLNSDSSQSDSSSAPETDHRFSATTTATTLTESQQQQQQQQPQKADNDPSSSSFRRQQTQENSQTNTSEGASPVSIEGTNAQIETTTQNKQKGIRTTNRVESLDAFRGLTIAGMIMVNYGGAGYTFLEHKPWDGITLADLVFPFFIFSMGASIAISLRSMFVVVGKQKFRTIWQIFTKILRRSIILMALGICLNSKWLNYPGANLNQLRLTGVLQRFSISYFSVATIYCLELALKKWLKSLNLSKAQLISNIASVLVEFITALSFLAIYLYFTFFFEYTNDGSCPPGYTGPGGQTELGTYANCTGGAAAWLDKLILGQNHLYHDHELKAIFKTQVSHDPEGILGSTTSILLTLIGLQCGKTLSKHRNHRRRLLTYFIWIILLSISCAAIIFIPINKRLWSLTFVTVTGASVFLVISFLYLIIDVYNCKRTFLLRLLISAGKNSIFLYVGHSLLNNMLPWHFVVDESSHLQLLIRLTWATFVWLLIAQYLASKKLFIKI